MRPLPVVYLMACIQSAYRAVIVRGQRSDVRLWFSIALELRRRGKSAPALRDGPESGMDGIPLPTGFVAPDEAPIRSWVGSQLRAAGTRDCSAFIRWSSVAAKAWISARYLARSCTRRIGLCLLSASQGTVSATRFAGDGEPRRMRSVASSPLAAAASASAMYVAS